MRADARSDIELVCENIADLESLIRPERLRQLSDMRCFQRWNVAAVTGCVIERLQPITAARDVNRVKHNGI